MVPRPGFAACSSGPTPTASASSMVGRARLNPGSLPLRETFGQSPQRSLTQPEILD
jgi:hypothetical protein